MTIQYKPRTVVEKEEKKKFFNLPFINLKKNEKLHKTIGRYLGIIKDDNPVTKVRFICGDTNLLINIFLNRALLHYTK